MLLTISDTPQVALLAFLCWSLDGSLRPNPSVSTSTDYPALHENASILSQAVCAYALPYLRTHHTDPTQQPQLPLNCEPIFAVRAWRNEVFPRWMQESLLWRLIYHLRWLLIHQQLLSLLIIATNVAPSFFISAILSYLSEARGEIDWHAAALPVLGYIVSVLGGFCVRCLVSTQRQTIALVASTENSAQSWNLARDTTGRLRAVLLTEVYAKTLRKKAHNSADSDKSGGAQQVIVGRS